jgi:UDPglucose 6-dehydrogenase
MKIGIVGYGTVGISVEALFRDSRHELVIYDKFKTGYESGAAKQAVAQADLVFVCVPTPALPSGACDTSAVEECVEWIKAAICIKSTIPPGTTDKLAESRGKPVVFSPEYIGETRFHPYKSNPCTDLVVVGGARQHAAPILDLYQEVLGPIPRYFLTDAIVAEFAKYMENSFLAMKVAFVGQFYQLATALNVDFQDAREIWLADSRIGRSHSAVIGNPGFGGSCLPKDLAAIIDVAKRHQVHAHLLEAVQLFDQTRQVRESRT